MNGKAQAWDGLAELSGMRLVTPNRAPSPAPRIMFLTVKVENPDAEAINTMAALMGGTVAVRIGPDE